MDGMNYDPMVMDGEPEQPQVKISAVWEAPLAPPYSEVVLNLT